MCTGLELAMAASAAASGVGGLISASQADKQQAAITQAQTDELMQFLQRNQGRADEAASVFQERVANAGPDAARAGQDAAAADRVENMESAVSAAPAAAAPVAGSAATVIGDVYRKAGERETGKRKKQTGAAAKLGSFGDQWFGQGLMTADAAQDIGMIGDFGRTDAGMLGSAQDLSGAAAGLRTQPGPFGSILSGLGKAGGTYFGSRAGR
jgi:hypothetical protein